MRATACKPASSLRLCQVRDRPVNKLASGCPRSHLDGWDGIQQCLAIGMARRGKETLPVRIFHELAHIHDSDVVTHMLNDPEIMADEQIGQAELRLQGFQQVQNLRLYGNVKR